MVADCEVVVGRKWSQPNRSSMLAISISRFAVMTA